jgi:hypothetical protein
MLVFVVVTAAAVDRAGAASDSNAGVAKGAAT